MHEPSTGNPSATSHEHESDDLMFQFDLTAVGEFDLAGKVVNGCKQTPTTQNYSNPVIYPVDREEMLVLAEHWSKVIFQDEEMMFLYGQYSAGPSVRHAHRELRRLEEVLGTDAVKEVWEEASLAMRGRIGDLLWEIYQHGTAEERDRVVDETYDHMRYCDEKLADLGLKARAMTYLRDKPSGFFVDEDGDLWSLVDANGDASDKDDRLVLLFTTRSKGSVVDPTACVDRPVGWVAPTWFGRWWQS